MRPERERLLLTGGAIRTGNPAQPLASGVLVGGGEILWVGDVRDAPRADRTIDLLGSPVVPGLTDAHIHLFARAQERLDLELGPEIVSIADLLERLARAAAQPAPSPWIVASGYNEQRLRERRHPTRAELDAIGRGRPILLRRAGGHLAVANTAALRAAGWGEDAPDPPAGRLERNQGCLTGVLTESAADLAASLAPKPTGAQLRQAIRNSAEECLRYGIVAAVEAAVGFTSGFATEWDAWAGLRRGGFPLRMGFMLRLDPAEARRLGLAPSPVDLDWQVRTLKFFVDGIIGARSAAVSEPFSDRDTLGLFMDDPDALRAKVADGHAAGWQLAAHTIGDRAIDLWLDCLGAAQAGSAPGTARHRIEHFALPGPTAPARAAALGTVIVTQHGFLRTLGASFVAALGTERAQRLYPGRSLRKAGLVVAGSSDLPIGPPSPFVAMATAIDRASAAGERIGPAEAMTVEEALATYTTGGAWAMGHEQRRGAIRPGHVADLAVLDCSPDAFRGRTAALESAMSRLTLIRGRVAYSDGTLA